MWVPGDSHWVPAAGEPPPWCNRQGEAFTKEQADEQLLPGWRWAEAWATCVGRATDKMGWQYAPRHRHTEWSAERHGAVVRRRRWVRSQEAPGLDDPLQPAHALQPGRAQLGQLGRGRPARPVRPWAAPY